MYVLHLLLLLSVYHPYVSVPQHEKRFMIMILKGRMIMKAIIMTVAFIIVLRLTIK